jgi:hypothetical protein
MEPKVLKTEEWAPVLHVHPSLVHGAGLGTIHPLPDPGNEFLT